MATDYGTDLSAILAFPPTGVLVSGDRLAAQSLALQLLTPTGALDEIGDPGPYDSINVRDWLGDTLDEADLRGKESEARQVLNSNPRASEVSVSITYTAGTLAITVRARGAAGPFGFVLSVGEVNSFELLQVA